ncbi:MAG TPA: chemotaxis protein CheA, partial [Nitrospirota bacterium]|nr:chemotaxis protein CheA [Nitrospirota bacterium]
MLVTKELLDVTLAARDHIESLFDVYYRDGMADENMASDIIATLKKILPSAAATRPFSSGMPVKTGQKEQKSDLRHITYRIRFRPSKGFFSSGTNPVLLL